MDERLELATKLGDRLGRAGKAEVTLVDRSPAHAWKPMLHAFAAGTANPNQHRIPFLDHARFHFSPFTVCFNLTGQPAIVLPLGRCDATPERTATGFPTAVPLVARYGDEATLFRLVAQLEKARPWFDRKPLVASDSKST